MKLLYSAHELPGFQTVQIIGLYTVEGVLLSMWVIAQELVFIQTLQISIYDVTCFFCPMSSLFYFYISSILSLF